MNEPTATGETTPDERVVEELRREFPQAGGEDLRRWVELQKEVARLKERLQQLRLPSEGAAEVERLLSLAERHLDFKRPYTIAVIGEKGAGKSALINTFFGEYLLPSRGGAEAVTGTVVKVKRRFAAGGEARKVGKVYYDEANLVGHVRRECDRHKLTPVFAGGDGDAQRLNVEATLKAVAQKRESLGGAPQGAEQSNALADLQNVLTAMKKYAGLLEGGSEEFDLGDDGKRKEFHDRLDEMSDDRTKEARRTAIVDYAEVEFTSPAGGDGDGVAVELIDVPGTGVNNARHREIIRRQLDPQKLDAVILVVAKATRFGHDTKVVIPLVKSVLMEGVPPAKRLDFAERIFVVVNKDDDIASEQQLNTDLRNLSDDISPGFWERYSKSNIFRVMADAGLIGKLLARHPAEGRAWLNGAQTDRFPATLADKGQQWQKTINKFPEECQAKEDYGDKFLCGSGVTRLTARLHSFLRDTRLKRDLSQAYVRYREAGERAYRILAEGFETIVGRRPSEQPLDDVQAFRGALNTQFSLQIQREVKELLSRFYGARHSLAHDGDSRKAFADRTKAITEAVMAKVRAKTASAEFQEELLRGGKLEPAKDIIHYSLSTRGSLPPLKDLDLLILGWLDDEARGLSETMIAELRGHIARHDVMALLDRLTGVWERADEFKGLFEAGIINTLQRQYSEACRGVVACRLLEFEPVAEITTGGKDRASEQRGGSGFGAVERTTGDKQLPDAHKLKEQIDGKYAETFGKLNDVLNAWLFTLFSFLLTRDAAAEVVAVADNLAVALIQELTREESHLYKHMLAEQAPHIEEAQRLAQELEALKQFRAVTH
ncbi:MAG TPA: dynamin family protein [Pyrinomonadaceae bacterium]|jgi:hypothetical protein